MKIAASLALFASALLGVARAGPSLEDLEKMEEWSYVPVSPSCGWVGLGGWVD